MTDETRAKLAEGLKAVVSAAMAPNENPKHVLTIGCELRRDQFYNDGYPAAADTTLFVYGHNHEDLPHLTSLQTLGLRLLLNDADPGLVAAAVDALVEAGVVPDEMVEVVRRAERERVEEICRAEMARWDTSEAEVSGPRLRFSEGRHIEAQRILRLVRGENPVTWPANAPDPKQSFQPRHTLGAD